VLRIVNLEEIEGLLLALPDIVKVQEKGGGEFPERVATWLEQLEKVLAANRLFQTGSIAALRSAAVAAATGSIPGGLQMRGAPTHRRFVVMVASHLLQRACDIASAVVAENKPRLAEGERVAQQLVAVAASRGLIMPREAGVDNTQYLRALRHGLAASQDLASAVAHLEGLVGAHDTLVLLDRAIGVGRVDSH
jgi:hypothetical protein